MGYYADRSKGRGQLYLITRDEEPFCALQYHVKIETSPGEVPIVSYGKLQITLVGDSSINETFMMTRKEDEEMKLGESIERILVPHPILSEPTKIQILYTAYSGWLSSGLTQWRMDKVTLSDSFGKISSVCKKNLILDSGVPVTLPLYPGECNLPGLYQKEAQDRVVQENPLNLPPIITNTSKFTPTPVIRMGVEDLVGKENKHSIDWKSDESNKVPDNEEAESSRAFNTRIIKKDGNLIKEIVEPILKPHSSKNARFADLDSKPEISEPILGPTTAKSFGETFKVESDAKTDFLTKLLNNNKEISYNFYDVDDNPADWVDKKLLPKNEKWKREDRSKSIKNDDQNNNPLEMFAMTVQFLPQRLAQMFEQAEKYARETILPLVSTYTPKFISEIITPKEEPKYLPLRYEEETTTPKIDRNIKKSEEKRNFNNDKFDPPSPEKTNSTSLNSTKPITHIQKIKRKSDNISSTTQTSRKEVSRIPRDESTARKNILQMELASTTTKKGVYINLPIFESENNVKYIPLKEN